MDDDRLISELVSAARRPHVTFDPVEASFVRKLKGRHELTAAERKRAARIFAERIDW